MKQGTFDKKLGLVRLLGFNSTTMSKVVGMIPHSIQAHDGKRRMREETACRGVSRCGKAARRPNMRNQPHRDPCYCH